MNEELKAKIERIRAEDEARWKRRDSLVEREGIDKMSEEDMRRNLVTCDFRGKEVKAIVLDVLLERKCAEAIEAERERQDRE